MSKLKPLIFGGEMPIFDYAQSKTEEVFSNTGNTGNMAFRSAIHKHLGRRSLTLNYSALQKYHNSNEHVAVIPCANHLGPHSSGFGEQRLKLFKGVKLPMVAIGLGAQAKDANTIPNIPDSVIEWLKIVVENAPSDYPNISVRGEFSKKVMNDIGFKDQTVALGCPSLFLNSEKHLGTLINRRINKWPPKRIAVSAGNPLNPRYVELESALARIINKHDGRYIVQHPLEMVKMARNEFDDLDNVLLEKAKQVLVPHLCEEDFVLWSRKHMRAFFDVYAWMEYLKSFDLVFGSRIHGTMLALQAGTPAVCIVHDSRTKELCETMCVPYIDISSLEIERLDVEEVISKFVFNSEQFDENRLHLAHKYVTFLRKNKMSLNESLLNIIK